MESFTYLFQQDIYENKVLIKKKDTKSLNDLLRFIKLSENSFSNLTQAQYLPISQQFLKSKLFRYAAEKAKALEMTKRDKFQEMVGKRYDEQICSMRFLFNLQCHSLD